MSYSQATTVKRIRMLLGDNPYIDTCTEAMDTTEVGLDVADGTEWQEGDIVEFSDDGELCYVQSVSSNTLTVIRNYRFSVTSTAGTGTSHSINTVIYKTPIYPYSEIVQAVENSLQELWPYVYKKYPLTKTPSTTSHWYDLDTTIEDISSVYQLPGTSGVHIFYYGVRGDTYPFEFIKDTSTTVVTSGVGLFIPYLYDTSNTIYINGIARITSATNTGAYTDFSDGVEATAVIYFAVAELIATKDIVRTTQEDVSMGDQSVRPLTRTQLSEYWRSRAIKSRRQWELQLAHNYPRYVPRTNRRGRRSYR